MRKNLPEMADWFALTGDERQPHCEEPASFAERLSNLLFNIRRNDIKGICMMLNSVGFQGVDYSRILQWAQEKDLPAMYSRRLVFQVIQTYLQNEGHLGGPIVQYEQEGGYVEKLAGMRRLEKARREEPITLISCSEALVLTEQVAALEVNAALACVGIPRGEYDQWCYAPTDLSEAVKLDRVLTLVDALIGILSASLDDYKKEPSSTG